MSEAPEFVGPELPAGGRVLPIVRWGEPVMHRPATPVTDFGAGFQTLVRDMVATMYAAEGVGLAACQVGSDAAVFVYDCPDDTGERHTGIVANPTLWVPEGNDRRLDDDDEGCLSFPGSFIKCARPDHARVTGQGLNGEPVEYEGRGFLARCLQHESDHLQGMVFGDRISDRARKKLTKQMQSAAEDFPIGWPAS